MSKLLDTDGENLALRTFLLHYQNPGVTIVAMRNALRRSGFDGCWPKFAEAAADCATLTKAGAQLWIRHLLSLESVGDSIAWQFKSENGEWHTGMNVNNHRENTKDAGYEIRELCVCSLVRKANYIIIDKDYCVFKAIELTDAIHEALEKKLISVLRLSDLTGIAIDGTWEDIQDWHDEFVDQVSAA